MYAESISRNGLKRTKSNMKCDKEQIHHQNHEKIHRGTSSTTPQDAVIDQKNHSATSLYINGGRPIDMDQLTAPPPHLAVQELVEAQAERQAEEDL